MTLLGKIIKTLLSDSNLNIPTLELLKLNFNFRYHVHVLLRGQFTFLVVSDTRFSSEKSFEFLTKV